MTTSIIGTIKRDRDDTTITVEGHVTAQNAHDLKQAIVDGIERIRHLENVPGLIIDLTTAATVGSSGITALVSGARFCIAAGKELFILGDTAELRDVLKGIGPGLFTFMQDLPR